MSILRWSLFQVFILHRSCCLLWGNRQLWLVIEDIWMRSDHPLCCFGLMELTGTSLCHSQGSPGTSLGLVGFLNMSLWFVGLPGAGLGLRGILYRPLKRNILSTSATGIPFCIVVLPLGGSSCELFRVISGAVYVGICKDHGHTWVWFGNEILRQGYSVVHWVKPWVLTKNKNTKTKKKTKPLANVLCS